MIWGGSVVVLSHGLDGGTSLLLRASGSERLNAEPHPVNDRHIVALGPAKTASGDDGEGRLCLVFLVVGAIEVLVQRTQQGVAEEDRR